MFPIHRLRAASAALLLGSGLATAQVPISGSLSDSTTGPLAAGVVYHATSSITVPAGQTLTVGAGAIVKMVSPVVQIHVDGTLDVNGLSGSPAIFTVINDDSAGGDTNANGPSNGLPGEWRGMNFSSTSGASTLDFAELRFSGNSGFNGIDLSLAPIAMNSVTIRDCAAAGLDLSSSSTGLVVANCAFIDNGGVAVINAPINAIGGFTDNTVSGNGGDYAQVVNGALTSSLTLAPSNLLGGALVTSSPISVPAGMTLTLNAGAIVKSSSVVLQHSFSGTLDANGTAGNPVIFTVFADDSAGGDTNGDGPSVGLPGSQRGLIFNDTSDLSDLLWTEVRFAGNSFFNTIELSDADITLMNVTLRDAASHGLDLNGGALGLTVEDCVFTNNGGDAVVGVRIDAVPQFIDNTASGNGGNFMRVSNGTLLGDVVLRTYNLLGGALVMDSPFTIAPGQILTLQQGVIIKTTSVIHRHLFDGTLVAGGTLTNPVIFTVFADDSAGGDTNNDGPSAGVPGSSRGLQFLDDSVNSALAWSEVRYAGNSFFPGIGLNAADIALFDVIIRDGASAAIDLQSTSKPTVRDCVLKDNGTYAVQSALIDAVPGFSGNIATGNGTSGTGGNYIQVTGGTPAADLSISDESVLGGALVLTSNLSVNAGDTLTLGPGVVIKFVSAVAQGNVGGGLVCNGTVARPVVFTSIFDDEIGGDTNADGAGTVPAPGNWRRLSFSSVADTSLLENVLVRYCGNSFFPGVTSTSPGVTLRAVRVERGSGSGFELHAATEAVGLCAWNHTLDGVRLMSGSFDVSRVTAASNGGDGVERVPAYTGVVRDSLAWGNAGSNYNGFSAGQLTYSNGDTALAGSNGNIDADPFFVDEPNGDIGLLLGSPCIDTGDPLSEQDPDCTRADMGCEYYDHAAPFTYCTAKTNSQGCVPFIDFNGFASATDPDPFLITGNDVLNGKSGLFFYSVFGAQATSFQGGTMCVGTPRRRTPVSNSGGDPPPNNCSGTFVINFNARIQSGFDPTLVPGVDVNGQWWMRDPTAPFTTGLTDGIQFRICP
jgi:hypothetical protein